MDFLRTIDTNPERKIEEVSKELGMIPVTAARWLQEFIESAVMTDKEPDFPRKFLLFYNKDLPKNEEGLEKSDVDQLRGYVKDYCRGKL